MLLDVRVTDEGGGQVAICLTGELDLAAEQTLPGVVSAAVEAGATSVVLDLREISFVDSRGLGLLLVTSRQLVDSGASLLLRAPSPSVRQLLELSRLDDVLPIEGPPPA